MLENPVYRYILHVIAWFPLAFLLWYTLATPLTWPLTRLADWTLTGVFPELFSAIEQQGYRLEVVTQLNLSMASQRGVLAFDINPLIYSYSLPLFSALLFSTPAPEWLQWRRWLLAFPLLLLLQTWGVVFEALKTVFIQLAAELPATMQLSQMQLEGIALGYQTGTLILPTVAPILLWGFFSRDFLQQTVSPSLQQK
jgi:hypothetical protein